jgi:geranylgeranyl diphosphate synthase type I
VRFLDIKEELAKNAVNVDRFIKKILLDKEPQILYEAASHLIFSGGKRMRPYLTVKACEAVGGKIIDALPYAAALEILHVFTLIHDDIMDNDPIRRGVPSVHTKWNIPVAICSGDLLFAKVFEIMTEYAPERIDPEKINLCIQKTAYGTIQICEGQVRDVMFPNSEDVDEQEYILMVGGKTAALFKTCAEVGAIIGGGSLEQIEILGQFAWDSGIAFQLIDDYLGATANEEELGKPLYSDLREGKKTLILIDAQGKASKEQKMILDRVIGNGNAEKKEIEEAIETLKSIGSIEHTLNKSLNYVEKAKTTLGKLPESKTVNDLMGLVDYFVKRTY